MRHLQRRFSARVLDTFARGPVAEGLSVRAAKDSGPVEILIYDFIGEDMWGEGVTAKGVLAALAQADGAPVRLRVNSPGGDVFEGLAIYNHLKAYAGGVETTVDGLAASAASFIALAGGGGAGVTMGEGAMFMVHNAWTISLGDRHDLMASADLLGKIDGQMAGIYEAATGKPAAEWSAIMDAETWFTAAEAQDAGLAKGEAKAAKAAVDPAAQAARRRLLRLALAQ